MERFDARTGQYMILCVFYYAPHVGQLLVRNCIARLRKSYDVKTLCYVFSVPVSVKEVVTYG